MQKASEFQSYSSSNVLPMFEGRSVDGLWLIGVREAEKMSQAPRCSDWESAARHFFSHHLCFFTVHLDHHHHHHR